MHEPLTCGALPTQQARVHNDPAATGSSGRMPDRKAPSSTETNTALTADLILNLLELDRSIEELAEGFCHALHLLASIYLENMVHRSDSNPNKQIITPIEKHQ